MYDLDLDMYAASGEYLSEKDIRAMLASELAPVKDRLRKVLLLPPDYTRLHSRAGLICACLYEMLRDTCQVDVLPALGTHVAMTEKECADMFRGVIPYEKLIVHDWRNDVVKIGEVPRGFVKEVSEGCVDEAIAVEVNCRIMDPSYDMIFSVGQVVPHEVVGMANRNKNIFVGCGGSAMINASHKLGAFYGLERLMGHDHSPVRKVFDYAEEHFLQSAPITYILTVCRAEGVCGLLMGRARRHFEKAVKLSQELNLEFVDEPLKKVVVYLDPSEFRSTWLGNKSIYRTRMAIADGGELIVLAPAVSRFGEDEECDRLIRKYGYCGREKVLELCRDHEDLRGNMSAAAHMIHGSSDGRFHITYCPGGLTKEETEQACFGYMPYEEAAKRYDPAKLKDGFNTLPDGEEIYYISNPALGLWADRRKFV